MKNSVFQDVRVAVAWGRKVRKEQATISLSKKMACIVSLLFLFSICNDAFGTPLTIDFSGTIENYRTFNTEIDGFLPGDTFAGSLLYDYEAASSLVAQNPSLHLVDITGALQVNLNFSGYAAVVGGAGHNGFTTVSRTSPDGGVFFGGSGGGLFFTPPSPLLAPVYFEYVDLYFLYNDASLDPNLNAAPDPGKFMLTSILISGLPVSFSADGSIDPASPIPEPAAILLMCAGLAGIGWMRRRGCH